MERYSVGMINELSMCGMLTFFRLQGYERVSSLPAVAGKAAHASIEDNLRHKMSTGSLLPAEKVIEDARVAFETFMEEDNVRINEDDMSVDDQRERAMSFALMHHEHVAPNLDPVAVEKRFDIRIKEVDAQLSGYIDVIDQGAATNFRKVGLIVRDTKTTGKTPSDDVADKSIQLQMYAMAVSLLMGRKPIMVAIDALVITKSRAHAKTATAPVGDFHGVLLRIEHAINNIRSGNFVPTQPDNWKCCDKWCQYWADDCPFGRRSRTSFVKPKELGE